MPINRGGHLRYNGYARERRQLTRREGLRAKQLQIRTLVSRAKLSSTRPLVKCRLGIGPISFRHNSCSGEAERGGPRPNSGQIEWRSRASGGAGASGANLTFAEYTVHSLKDLETWLPDRLAVACVLPRDDPRDALLSAQPTSLASLPTGGASWHCFAAKSICRASSASSISLAFAPDLVEQAVLHPIASRADGNDLDCPDRGEVRVGCSQTVGDESGLT